MASQNGAGTGSGPPDLTIIHFNDVYDVESQKKEPIGGAARFCTAVKKYAQLNPVVLFSGDCFSPSLLSQFTKGEQMIPVLNHCRTDCSVFGNHDFDFGVDILADWVKKTTFPWLMSNVIDNETNRPLGEGHITQVLERHGRKIGLMGLVEWEWMETLSTIDPEAVTYTDYVDAGNDLSAKLRKEGCDIIVALTHMRFPNDCRLAENCKGIDLILGGHDHVYDINGIPVLKSGTDFRDFSAISVTFDKDNANKPKFNIERISITSDYEEDAALKAELDVFTATMSSKLEDILGEFHVDIDGRFEVVRTQESNLGNFVCDIMVASCNGDCSLVNSGTLRSDRIHPAGPFTRRDMMTVLPMMDSLVVLNVTGSQLIEALENGVSQYPKLEGRFPQISGLRFAFDPSKPAGNRVDPKFVKVGDEYLQPHQSYRLVTKEYIATGHDGYTVLANAEVLADSDQCLELSTAIQNHFHAVQMVGQEVGSGTALNAKHSRHHQSLITLSRRHSLLRSMSAVHDLNHASPSLDRCNSLSPRPSLSRQGNVVEEMEKQTCLLKPMVEGRIVVIKDKNVLHDLMNERKDWEASRTIKEEDENVSPTTPTVMSRLHALYHAAVSGSTNNRSPSPSDFSDLSDVPAP
ncbi:Trifunctional nucleotide phosphoesterase protein YfkN [Folsomia candida]|uniref:Trifunctional nucleotide phosphoesterase protein YfkN n=1 Tax=Folsomia candida TaxID=158441 RepID=A0A226DE28_FOLCA|nr:Trifunctional nucleotide phosphoesterase protein YfkN [Folsomia candida]